MEYEILKYHDRKGESVLARKQAHLWVMQIADNKQFV